MVAIFTSFVNPQGTGGVVTMLLMAFRRGSRSCGVPRRAGGPSRGFTLRSKLWGRKLLDAKAFSGRPFGGVCVHTPLWPNCQSFVWHSLLQ